ncbi:MAG: DUF2125 domain-containing protein [Alphaproteobacteria bacterium]|jgi:hypothetical protein|nr:DUF2125 domain-containing protein [Alphaproteobacteria bacterium]MBT4464219.1 DUF2125 domain-containing protein [Rhodospirillaceae bacterium]MBT5013633.1 DUF2125 domain-containing protein [Rhodospirillaceae bacterium]MBT5308784.1 DUF2125 domain-containing protein [Rhodospirillaceae bacterium]MBT7355213.1 DUF2125 domain-containing protein [Rhodospirillaceae bacterium]
MIDSYRRPVTPTRSNKWLFVTLACAFAVVVYTGVWIYLATIAREATLDWVDARRGEGYTVRFDSMEETGYPMRIRLDIANPGIGGPNSPNPWGWEGEKLEVSLTPWDWTTVRLKTTGQQMLSFTMPDTEMSTYIGETENVSVSVGGRGLDVSINGLTLNGDKPGLGGLAVSSGRVHVEKPDSDGADMDIRLNGLRLPNFMATPLGKGIREFQVEARLQGHLESGPMRDSLEVWRDAGGTIEIERLSVRHGPLALKGDGTLALDAALQPIGAFTAHVEGFFDAIDALKETGLVKSRDAVAAKMILGVMSRRSDNGGPPILNLALTLQDRQLFAGPVGLMKFDEVDWKQFGRID